MSMPIELLRAVPEHAQALAELMRRCFLQAYHHASSPDRVARFLDTAYATAQVRSELEDPALPTWIVRDRQQQWAGFGRLRLHGSGHPSVAGNAPMELQRFYLDAAFHGRGVATQLMAHLIDHASGHGADALWLNVWQEAPQAIRFYRKHGFEIVGTNIFMVDDDPKDDWVMRRPL